MPHSRPRTELNETDFTASLSWGADTGHYLFLNLVNLALEESVKCLDDLNQAIADDNQHQVDHAMCRLRSTCLIYQSDQILEISRLIQVLFKKRSTRRLSVALRTLTSAVDRMLQTLRLYKQAQPLPSLLPASLPVHGSNNISPLVLVGEDLIAMQLVQFVAETQGLDVIQFASTTAAIEHLRNSPPALVVFGLMLGDIKGLELCRQLRSTTVRSRHHILIFTTDSRAKNLNRILDVGADDFILKPITPDHLNVRLLVAQKNMASMLQTLRLEKELRRQSLQDGLTGLGNRRALEAYLKQEQSRPYNDDLLFQVMFIDLNDLKRINDLHGHVTGDNAIRLIANLAREQLSKNWELFRIGGDEFLAVSITHTPQQASQQCQAFRHALKQNHLTTDRAIPLPVNASVGLATVPIHSTLEHLLHLADIQLYQAKRKKQSLPTQIVY